VQTSKNLKIKLSAVAASTVAAISVAAIGDAAEGALVAELPTKSTLERAVDRHKAERSYERVLVDAKKHEVAPKADPTEQAMPLTALARKTDELQKAVKKAKAKPDFPAPETVGVSQSTLDAIASCESGGDYATNTGNGFSGAYQFMDSTWQAVGGSTPSAYLATPEEQDYRAAVLYSTSGPGQWPVCGA